MEGVNDPPDLRGIIPRAVAQIFEMIAARGGENTEFLVRASYLEIYNEEVRDLLHPRTASKSISIREDAAGGIFVMGEQLRRAPSAPPRSGPRSPVTS